MTTGRAPGAFDDNSRIQFYVDGEEVIQIGQNSGAIYLEGGSARWYFIELIHRVDLNKVTRTSGVPQVRLYWESVNLAAEIVDYKNAIAIDIKEKEWPNGVKLKYEDYKLE